MVGNEGLIGIALFMGGETTPSRAIVQSAGHAYRLIGQHLKDEFHRGTSSASSATSVADHGARPAGDDLNALTAPVSTASI